jgi:hypothetical protein
VLPGTTTDDVVIRTGPKKQMIKSPVARWLRDTVPAISGRSLTGFFWQMVGATQSDSGDHVLRSVLLRLIARRRRGSAATAGFPFLLPEKAGQLQWKELCRNLEVTC